MFLPGAGSGLVVVALAAWVVFRRWPQLRAVPFRAGSPVLIALSFGAASALLAWAIYARASDLLAPSLALAGVGLATLRGGAAARRVLALPLLMLLFVLTLPPPLYNAVIWKLQLWTSSYSAWLLEAIGIEATVSADLIFRDRHLLNVIEGCSGMRSIEILMLLSLLMKELFGLRKLETLALFLLAPFVAFALNGVRIAVIALMPNPDEALEHTGQGIATLIGGCVVLFGIVLAMERLRGTSGAPLPAAPGAPGAPLAPGPASATRHQRLWSTALIASLAILSLLIQPPPPAGRAKVGIQELFPTEVGRATSTELDVPWRFLGQAMFRESLNRRYERPNAPKGTEVELFIGIGARDDTSFSSLSTKTIMPGPGWVEEDWSRVPSSYGDAKLDVVVIRAGTARRLVHRFTAGELGLGEETLRAIFALDATPFRSAPDEVVVRLSTPLRNGSTAERRMASARLTSFTQALDAPLRQLLSNPPGGRRGTGPSSAETDSDPQTAEPEAAARQF